jgi:NAD+ synthase
MVAAPAPKLEELKSSIGVDAGPLARSLESFIREHVEKLEREGVILGLSGGIDSAVVAALCARAVGPEKTLALVMPDRDSWREHIKDALSFAAQLGIKTKLINITPYLRKLGAYKLFFLHRFPLPKNIKAKLAHKAHAYFERKTGKTPFSAGILGIHDKQLDSYLKNSTAYYRIKHRLRMVLLYLHAERENRLVVGAANKTEYRIGFFVKHGCDDAADVMPLLHLYKTQVRELARALDLPARIINKAPSPDIIPGITDEEAIGIPYEKLDLILLALEKGWEIAEVAAVLELEQGVVERVTELTERSAHMRTTYVPDI